MGTFFAAQCPAMLFQLPVRHGSKAVFADPYVENMKFNTYGAKGHFDLSTVFLDRAVLYLRATEVEFHEESWPV